MNNKKKLSLLVLSMLTVAGLAACGTSEASSAPSSSEAPSSETASSSSSVSSSSEAPAPAKYAVAFEGANVKAFGLPAESEAGTQITFTVVAAKGYILESVVADKATLAGDANDGYTFTMPEGTVKITAKAVKEDEQYAVAFTGNNLTAFGLPAKSLAGQTINFFVKANDGYTVKSVSIEGVTLNGSVSNGFSFVMPAKNVSVNAVAEAIPQGFEIEFEGSNAYAVDLPAQAKAGDTVNFRVAAASGFAIQEVSAEADDGALIKLNGSLADGYSFRMPDSKVKISATALGAFFKAAANTEKTDDTFVFKAQDENASKKYFSDFIKGFVADDKVTTGQNVYARAGSQVYVLVDNISIAEGVKILVNGKEATKENYDVKNADGTVKETYNAYKFEMPANDVNLTVAVEKEKQYTVKASTAEHYTARTYKLVDEEPIYTTKFYGGETVYVEFNLKLGYEDRFIFSGVSVTYDYYSSYNMKTTSANNMADTVEAGHVYKMKVSTFTNYATDITFQIDYKEAKYAGKEFVGEYSYVNIYGGTKGSYFNGKVTFDAAGSGKIGYNSVEIVDGSLDETAKKFSANNKGTTSKRDVYYDGDLLWTPDAAGTNYSDVDLAIKGVTTWSEIDYRTNTDFNMNSLAYVTIYRKGTDNLIGNFIRVDGHNFLNVEIEFANGSTEVKVGASFKVKKNGQVVYEYNCAPVSSCPLVGTWKSGSNTLTFADDNTGTFNNTYSTFNFTYTYNATTKVATLSSFGAWDGDNTATYKENNDTVVLDVDDEYYENHYYATFTRQA